MADVPGFLKDYGPAFAWVIAAIGWALTNKQANNREKRKEFRAEIDAIEKYVQSIAEKTGSYLRLPERNDAALVLESEITVLFKAVDLRYERIAGRQSGGDLGLYLDEIIKFKEDLFDYSTGRYFETDIRVPAEELNARVQGLHVRALMLIESFHALFLIKFDNIRSLADQRPPLELLSRIVRRPNP